MRVFLLILGFMALTGCDRNVESSSSKIYKRGKNGGCYYVNKNGERVYVDKSKCY